MRLLRENRTIAVNVLLQTSSFVVLIENKWWIGFLGAESDIRLFTKVHGSFYIVRDHWNVHEYRRKLSFPHDRLYLSASSSAGGDVI